MSLSSRFKQMPYDKELVPGILRPSSWRKKLSICAVLSARCRRNGTRKALAGSEPGDILTVACTDPLASIDIPTLLRETGDALEEARNEARGITFRIRKL